MYRRPLVAFAYLAALSLIPGPARAADHRDSPRLKGITATAGNIDINDVYVFQSPNDKNNTVIIVTLSPAAGVIGPATFRMGALYEIRVQSGVNATTPFFDTLLLQLRFSAPNNQGRQFVQLTKVNPFSDAAVELAVGLTGADASIKGGGKLRASIFDDPFFFDLNAFNAFVERAEAGASLPVRVAPFLPPNIPNSFFAGLNTLAIVMEVPNATLGATKKAPGLRVWARTVVAGEQLDRMGIPAINTAIIPTSYKNAFNTGSPQGDPGFRELATEHQQELFGTSTAYASAVATALLPDVLSYNSTSATGFPNGRRLTDDVIDTELAILTNGALKTDRVGNDSAFQKKFPYLATPNPRGVGGK